LCAAAIYEALLAALGAEGINYHSVTRCLREWKFATSNPDITFLNGSVNMMIATMLSCSPEVNGHFYQYTN
jgi:hypothetical protein